MKKGLSIELEVAKKRMQWLVNKLSAEDIQVHLLSCDVLDGHELLTAAVVAFGSYERVQELKANWDKTLTRTPGDSVEIITKMKHMELKIKEEYEKWQREMVVRYFIYIDEHGKTFVALEKDGLRGMQRLVKGNIEIVPDGKRSIKPYLMICNEEGRLMKMKTNKLASLIIGRNVVGPVIICKETMDDFGDLDMIGLTSKELRVWRSKILKIQGSTKKTKK